jgi:phosphoglycolate phosphatase-like HAD superfamily hydrolase
MPKQSIELILFDIDGTLLWPRGAGRASSREAMLEVFGTCGAIEHHDFGGKTDWFTLTELLREEGFGAEDVARAIPAYTDAMQRHMERLIGGFAVEACPGAHVLLDDLRARGILLGLVTGNVYTTAPIKLRTAGFDPTWFIAGAYGSESIDRNHLPALALERAVQHARRAITPEQVVVVGDTVADIECARALGATAVAVLTGYCPPEELIAAKPDFLLNDLTMFVEAVLNGRV